MKALKIDSFVKTVSLLFSSYMIILMAIIIILHKQNIKESPGLLLTTQIQLIDSIYS